RCGPLSAGRMTDQDELARALEAIAAAFEELSVTWAIGGSLASSAHGEPRATNDIDVVATLDEAGARRLPALLGNDFYADADMEMARFGLGASARARRHRQRISRRCRHTGRLRNAPRA